MKGTKGMELILGSAKTSVSALDLNKEIEMLEAKGAAYEMYSVATEDEQGFVRTVGEMLWVPSVGRAGIMLGGNSVWTDAKDPEDAIRRHNEGEMAN